MSSLYDLIYSQKSNEPSSPAKKRPRHEEPNVDTQEQDMANTALDRFYKIPNVSSVVPEIVVSNNGVERLRKRKRGRPRRRRGQDEEEERWETASEAERRVQQSQCRTEYKSVKKRWKTRVHNLSEEIDYGNSVKHMARLVMMKNEKRQTTLQIETDRKPPIVQNVVMDSSDEEQRDALGSLWISMTPQEEPKDDMEEDELDEPWDYWQLGYNTPRIKDLQDFYYYQYAHNNPFELNYSGREQRLEEIENERVTLPPIRRNDPRKGVDEQMYYLQQELPTTCFTHSTFHHCTNLRTMAARFLTGSAGKNEELENRLLRDLYSKPTRKLGREYHVLTQCMERGREFVIFKSHRWKQRSVAARALGVTAEYEHTGPAHRIGFSLERDGGVDRVGLEHINNVVRLLSDGKLPYQPDENTCANNHVKDAGIEESRNIEHNENAGSDADQEEPDSRTDDQKDYDDIDSPLGTPRRTKVEIEEENKQNDPDAAFFRTYLSSDVDYVHAPGTTPPIPPFPLDETSVIVGGEDRYSRVHHHAKIDDVTYTVTVSVLLVRLGRARLQNDKRAIEQVQRQILTYVEEVANENVRLLTQMFYKRRKRNEQPSALYYKAMMGFCSFVANSGCSLARKHQHAFSEPPDWLDDDSDVDDAVPAEAKKTADMNAAAQTMYEQCAGCPNSSSLTIFPRIHITTALAFIAKHLPASAVDILSRPFDEMSYRTPFDIMRKVFEHLEKDNLLTDSHIMRSGEDAINVSRLEHIVHEATSMFHKVMEIDPCDLFNHAWYISGLASSLLLCSGNGIGPKAHVLPSSRKRNEEYNNIFISPEKVTTQSHEVRQRLPKFAALRRDVANAIKNMIELALAQKNSRGHLIASAVLEWKQVIALLVGPRSDGVWSDIRTLHSQHAVQWAIKERSQAALCMVKEMVHHQHVSSDTLLVILAADLESDPSNVFAWRRLVRALGPIGVRVSSRRRKECERHECAECKSLHKGWNVDHVMMAERENNRNWWGSDRVSWWDSHVLTFGMKSAVRATPIEIFRVGNALEKRLVQEARLRDEVSRERNAPQKLGVGPAFDEHADLRWLEDKAFSDNDDDFDRDQNDEDYDSLLPAHFEDMIRATQESSDAPLSLVFDRNEGDPKLEITCYKIILTCHLYSVSHDLVCDGVWLLAQGCSRKAECSEWRCLLWLSSMGLHLPQILHDLYTQRSPPRRARYPEEEKEAMRAGLELFSQKRKQKQPIWKDIRDHFPVFKDASRLHLSCIYLAMKRSGELGSMEET